MASISVPSAASPDPEAVCPARFPFSTPRTDPLGLGEEWAQARNSGALVQVLLPGGQRAWLATRYSAARAVYQHPHLTRGDADAIAPFPILGDLILTKDSEEHRKIRKLAASWFTPGSVTRFYPRIEEVTGELIDAMLTTGAPADLAQAIAFRLPLGIIGEIIGIPERDRPLFREWSDDLLTPADRAEEALAALLAMLDYLRGLLVERRQAPADDLMSAIAARADTSGVSDYDAALLAVAIVVGGWETVAAAVTSGAYRLLTTLTDTGVTWHWYLHDHPELIGRVVEELLRTVPSSQAGCGAPRRAKTDVEIDGVVIRAGELVIPAHDSANHDERVFTDPDRIDPARGNADQHLSFGHGAHFCLGASLARLELQVVFSALTRRLPNLRLACPPESLTWDTSTIVRRPRALPVTWD